MALYIGCIQSGLNGDQPTSACRWDSKLEFYYYCNEILAMSDGLVNRSMTVDQLCEAIYDVGFGGIGSRSYRRVARAKALPILN